MMKWKEAFFLMSLHIGDNLFQHVQIHYRNNKNARKRFELR